MFTERLVLAIIPLCLVGAVVAIVLSGREHSRLMAQCMADGKKEYECVSMLRTETNVVMPVVIRN